MTDTRKAIALKQSPSGAEDSRPRIRAERVRGNNMAEWRKNLSPKFQSMGDAVLAWVSESDLNAHEEQMILPGVQLIEPHAGIEQVSPNERVSSATGV